MPQKLFFPLICLFCLISCADKDSVDERSHQLTEREIKVLFLGDSLTAGYGVKPEEAYPSLIQNKLKEEQYHNVKIINESISGSTTTNAKSRLEKQLKLKPDVLLLALGANDGLRRFNLKKTKNNLAKAIKLAKENNIIVILAGMKIPTILGKNYSEEFEKLFIDLAKDLNIHFVPFLLEGVGGKPEFNQPDRVHPNSKGHQKMANIVYPHLELALKEVK